MSEFNVAAHCRDQLGEVPVWCERTSRLWWIDCFGPALRNLDPSSGEVTTVTPAGGRLGSIALREEGGLLLANAAGIHRFDPATGAQQLFVGRARMAAAHWFNDGRCDRQGRFWVGTMNQSLYPDAVLYRVDPDGTMTQCLDEITVSNGLAFSLDSRTMYFADTRRFTITEFDFDPAAGAISNRRHFADTTGRAGRPDGSCVDSEGFL
jgi:sugar lactone lactonase YvrE